MAADTTQKTNNYIARTNDQIVLFLDQYERLMAIYSEYYDLGYGGIVTDDVLANSGSPHLDQQMFMDGMMSIEAIHALMEQGHGTNLQRFRR
jgi:hypothetical protein